MEHQERLGGGEHAFFDEPPDLMIGDAELRGSFRHGEPLPILLG